MLKSSLGNVLRIKYDVYEWSIIIGGGPKRASKEGAKPGPAYLEVL
jgi:hypothetical protein